MTAPIPPTIDGLLDLGSEGLTFFEAFLPLVGASGAPMTTSHDALCARYDEQRGLDTEALRADADRLCAAAAEARGEIGRQSAAADALGQAWSGVAADAALDLLRRQCARSAAHADQLEAIGSAMASASAGLHAIVEDKSIAASAFRADQVGGRDAVQVAATIAGAGGASAPDAVRTLASVFPGLEAMLLAASDTGRRQVEVLDPVAARCREWLDTVFVPAMTERVAAFEELCTSTETAVSEIYAALCAAAADIDDSPWPSGHRSVEDDGCECVPAAATAPAAVTAPATAPQLPPPALAPPPVVVEPPTTLPVAPVPDRSPLADLIGRAVRDAVVEVVSGAVPCEPPPAEAQISPEAALTAPAENVERGHLEAELDGRGVSVALGADGAVDIRTHDAAGESHHLTLAAGPLGLPVLTEVVDEAAELPSEAPNSAGQERPDPEADELAADELEAADPEAVVEHPVVEPPVVEPPVVEPPVVEPPVAEPPVAEPPVAEPTVAAAPDCAPAAEESGDDHATEPAVPQPDTEPSAEAAAADEPARPELAEAGPL
ncbi:WXG100 family type VII secretion target [Rhodococcus sp. BP-349]|uniref:WXG100 family type VII secretion target n=1 Tax=unclassified Rhodococcus (in: high G+C Gram-positive bacteria) TaxID=192944 RepID=UPI001C9A825E|nr:MULTISPECIES: WXG100 family type VII secretion target [unclassified Rhodococcus (in: high G+C Gram-positive bacteria)]MBY6538727.1 WXG100 family type VII secretion target [Rhodococcus sp. BP-363]MBY6543064.1 WXG100 family type VII secretion target [Rhodococcus sp. BP-369]MBY6562294.1 WXG100 family type VII secretion target [Rhodococcus sp. BP-370]MBY6576586.1 WXG100 family type VII secretion target [Rhodococcus sp. BP-364]MBY6585887.1 WXG100 family type VII secretion target [Rhodococcus sp.